MKFLGKILQYLNISQGRIFQKEKLWPKKHTAKEVIGTTALR